MDDNEQQHLNVNLNVTFDDGSSTALTVLRGAEPHAPVLLVLPAMGVRATYYHRLGRALVAEGFHVVLADLRGNGGSSVRASRSVDFGCAEILELELPAIVASVCEEFDTEHLAIVGHSLGGQLGLLYATQTRRVSRVVLVASGSAWYRRFPAAAAVGRLLAWPLASAITLAWGCLPAWYPFAGREARRIVRDCRYEAMTGRYRISHSTIDYEQALAHSTVPARFVVFPGDPVIPEAGSEHLAGKLAAAEVDWQRITPRELGLRKTDHLRWARQPQPVVDAVTKWLRP